MILKSQIKKPQRDRKTTSASQIQTFKNCQRLWWFQVCGLRSPSSASQAIGTAIHAGFESYLKTGEATGTPQIQEIVNKGIRYLPDPDEQTLVEHEIALPTIESGPKIIGYIDLVYSDRPHQINILDHKSTKDHHWNLSENELQTNIQGLVYAKWAWEIPNLPWFPVPPNDEWRETSQQINKVSFAHHYVSTTVPGDVRLVKTEMPYDGVQERWYDIIETVQEMDEMAKSAPDSPSRHTPNTDFCTKYGGCWYGKQGLCSDVVEMNGNRLVTLSKIKRYENKIKEEKMESRFPQVQEKSPRKSLEERAADLKAAQATNSTIDTNIIKWANPALDLVQVREGLEAPWTVREGTEIELKLLKSIDLPKIPEEPLREGIQHPLAAPREMTPEEILAVKTEAETEGKKKRGRPTKKAQQALVAQTPGQVTETQMGDVAEKLRVLAVKNALASTTITCPQTQLKIAFCDCLPTSNGEVFGMNPISAESWLAPLRKQVADDLGVIDVKLADYGKGDAALAAYLEQCADTMPALIRIDSSFRHSALVKEVCVAHGYTVIQALRG